MFQECSEASVEECGLGRSLSFNQIYSESVVSGVETLVCKTREKEIARKYFRLVITRKYSPERHTREGMA